MENEFYRHYKDRVVPALVLIGAAGIEEHLEGVALHRRIARAMSGMGAAVHP